MAQEVAEVMAEEEAVATVERVPPYISFSTLITALDSLRELTLDHIDRTVFPSFSGGTYSQLIGTLRWFNLIAADFAIRPELRKLAAANEGDRKALLRVLIENSYTEKIVRGLARFSPKQIEDALAEFGISGATKRKSATFLINAAQHTGLTVSPLLAKKRRAPATSGGRRRRALKQDSEPSNLQTSVTPPEPATSRTLSVEGVGTITLSASVNIFKMPPKLRTAVFQINDILDEYERAGELAVFEAPTDKG